MNASESFQTREHSGCRQAEWERWTDLPTAAAFFIPVLSCSSQCTSEKEGRVQKPDRKVHLYFLPSASSLPHSFLEFLPNLKPPPHSTYRTNPMMIKVPFYSIETAISCRDIQETTLMKSSRNAPENLTSTGPTSRFLCSLCGQ
jgi:hypothetical protein